MERFQYLLRVLKLNSFGEGYNCGDVGGEFSYYQHCKSCDAEAVGVGS